MDKSKQLERLNKKLSRDFFKIYDNAIASPYVRKPVSYSLYRLWRKWDAEEKVRDAE